MIDVKSIKKIKFKIWCGLIASQVEMTQKQNRFLFTRIKVIFNYRS